jgi:hypothetical protein
MRSATTGVVVLAACTAISGCGLGAPAAPTTPSAPTKTTRSSLATAQATHEYPSPAPPAQTVGPTTSATASPVQAIRAFATRYVNWTADTVAGQMRTLASESVGQARSAMQLAAAQTAKDYELQRGGIANSGTVEAVAPLLEGRGQYVVITRELTSATDSTAYQGLRPAWHLTLATATQLSSGQWVLSRWQPES